MKIALTINAVAYTFDADPDMPLLWLIRDEAKLKGTKFGCGMALCGACSVHVDGDLIRSCSYPVQLAQGKTITTIEGLSTGPTHLHPIQQAWREVQVPQCGYCQSGFMMAAAHLLEVNKHPTEDDIKNSITNICRCGTHPRILKAILLAAKYKKDEPTQ
ncbi:(2Fe-2S)-binding protein [Arsenicibacter rosenii]|uniref:(2Fe-2S)-binding protein n=1 Tax=Arsenicibacter rosenii TaxID=1750698 RepID=A0A1S2VCQ7_9BACT|nr:(2Fe-2S)-binding protein [Arsenicibacter rosenii]OIN55718.1 (2Fe-2S)-binding protein [Arsenicibacter rosenii]